jgi:hypothetical protein
MWPVVNAWAMEQDQYFQIVKEFPECTGKVLVVLVARLVVLLRCCVVVFGCLVARLLALLVDMAGWDTSYLVYYSRGWWSGGFGIYALALFCFMT